MRLRIQNYPLQLLLVICLIFSIISPLASTLSGDADLDRGRSDLRYLAALHSLVFALTFPILIYDLTVRRKLKIKLSIVSFFCILGLVFSGLANENISPMFLIAIYYVFILREILRPGKKIKIPIGFYFISLIYCVGPLIFLFIYEDAAALLWGLGSFKGFGGSRTDYGFICGLLLITLVISRSPRLYLFIPIVLFALTISESRASIVSVLVSISFLLFSPFFSISIKNKLFFGVAGASGVIFLFLNYSNYSSRNVGLTTDSGDRLEKISLAISEIIKNPLFGNGAFYTQIYQIGEGGVEPHNSILQSLLNFGFLGAIPWFFYILIIFLAVNYKGRALLLYWFVFGLFHPGYDAYLFTAHTTLVLIAAALNPARSRLADGVLGQTKY